MVAEYSVKAFMEFESDHKDRINVFGCELKGKLYWHPISRFRLIRRAGEQPQPDMAKLIEEKGRLISEYESKIEKLLFSRIDKSKKHSEALAAKDEAIRELVEGRENPCFRFR